MSFGKNFTITLLVCLIHATVSFGQEIKNIGDLRFRHFQLKDGLPTLAIEKIFQDDLGVLWFGTYNGLVKYDGLKFKKILEGKVNAIYQDKDGFLWVGTNKDLIRYDPRTNTKKSHYYKERTQSPTYPYDIISITQDKSGAICVGTAVNGLLRYIKQKEKDSFLIIQYPTKEKAKSLSQNAVQGRWIWNLMRDSKDEVWFGTSESLIRMIIPDTTRPEMVKFETINPSFSNDKSFRVKALSKSQDGGFWVIGSQISEEGRGKQQIFKYNHYTGTFTEYLHSFTNSTIQQILEDDQKNLWLGCNREPLIFVPKDSIKSRGEPQSNFIIAGGIRYPFVDPGDNIIGINNIQGLHQDNHGSIWALSNFIGVFQIPKKLNLFKRYPIKSFQKFNNKTTSNVLPIAKNRVLVSSWRSGLVDYNIQDGSESHYFAESTFSRPNYPKTSLGLFKDSKGRIWVNSDQELMHEFHKLEGNLQSYKIEPLDFIYDQKSNYFLSHITEDPNGTLWMGSNKQGLIHFDPDSKKTIKRFYPNNSQKNWINDRSITYTASDTKGAIWFSTIYSGLHRLRTEKDTYVFDQFLTQYSNLGRILFDSKGLMWVGSFNDGLFLLNKETGELIQRFTTEDGLPSNHISDIWEGQNGWYWILSAYGLVKFHPEQKTSILFDEEYGIEQGQRLVSRMHLEDNLLYIGGEACFYTLNIEEQNAFSGTAPSRILLEELKINNKTVQTDTLLTYKKNLLVGQGDNNLAISFTAIHFDDPKGITYQYKLLPLDESWQDIGTSQIAFLNNVAPGSYDFKVRAKNEFGQIDYSIPITVKPFWWNSNLAKVVYGILVVLFSYFIARLYLNYKQEKIEKEKEQQMGGLRSRFFANISHEFKTPLTLISGPIGDRLRSSKNPSERQFFEKLHSQTDRMSRLVGELVDLSRAQENKLKLSENPTKVGSFLRLIAESFESLATKKNIKFNIEIDNLDFKILLDKNQFEKVLFNLLSNAFNHTPPGGSINLQASFTGKNELCIRVTNSGEPIPSSEIQYIFQQFYQAENATRQGSGIGLALVHEIIKLMNGEITVSSSVEAGTNFTVKLPVQKVNEPKKAVAIEPRSVDEEFMTTLSLNTEEKKKILIVEDNREIASYIQEVLASHFDIILAANGVEGLKAAKKSFPDLIVTDVMMPKMDGIEFSKRLKMNEELNHIPIVILTAKADFESRLEGLSTGAIHFISKPFNSQEFLLILENIIRSRNELIARYQQSFNLLKLPAGIDSLEERFMSKVIDSIKGNLDNSEYSIEEMASDLNLSRTHLYRKLKSTTGLTPSQFIRNFRLDHAAVLLQSNYDSVSRIAFEVGFNTLSYFSKCFKEKFGVLPRDYKGSLNT